MHHLEDFDPRVIVATCLLSKALTAVVLGFFVVSYLLNIIEIRSTAEIIVEFDKTKTNLIFQKYFRAAYEILLTVVLVYGCRKNGLGKIFCGNQIRSNTT